jgi:hypothetical protein
LLKDSAVLTCAGGELLNKFGDLPAVRVYGGRIAGELINNAIIKTLQTELTSKTTFSEFLRGNVIVTLI